MTTVRTRAATWLLLLAGCAAAPTAAPPRDPAPWSLGARGADREERALEPQQDGVFVEARIWALRQVRGPGQVEVCDDPRRVLLAVERLCDVVAYESGALSLLFVAGGLAAPGEDVLLTLTSGCGLWPLHGSLRVRVDPRPGRSRVALEVGSDAVRVDADVELDLVPGRLALISAPVPGEDAAVLVFLAAS
ncbi:MAG: hypothetical protein M9894_09320 [Planctomycetes bacterium]|nr:hypothetical protein [Planctomycetota bacterium]